MNVLDLFSGIGGFSLGLERAGMRTVAFCEIDPFCRAVLRKHWPNVPIYEDVRSLTAERLRADGIASDVICGGFPCQDISLAGKGEGIEGSQSGLWSEYRRLIGEIRPRYVIVENVAALLGRGLDKVLGDLAALGFDAEWHCIPASYVGAPHLRDRVWIVANPSGAGTWMEEYRGRGSRGQRACALESALVSPGNGPCCAEGIAASSGEVSDASRVGRRARGARRSSGEHQGVRDAARHMADADCKSVVGASITWPERTAWDTEPDVGRVVDGLPAVLVEDELRTLGNAVVPQIPEIIGRAILAHERERLAA